MGPLLRVKHDRDDDHLSPSGRGGCRAVFLHAQLDDALVQLQPCQFRRRAPHCATGGNARVLYRPGESAGCQDLVGKPR
jgi:hypothetical protein